MPKPIPQREKLICPRCRQDIGGFLDYDEIRAWLKRAERRLVRARMSMRRSDRRKAAVMLRRVVAMESGRDLAITDSGRKLGLKELSEKIVGVVAAEVGMDHGSEEDNAGKERELAKLVEKVIVDYFTSPS
jgi:hypothetical protein